jgi:hypothetical protein
MYSLLTFREFDLVGQTNPNDVQRTRDTTGRVTRGNTVSTRSWLALGMGE